MTFDPLIVRKQDYGHAAQGCSPAGSTRDSDLYGRRLDTNYSRHVNWKTLNDEQKRHKDARPGRSPTAAWRVITGCPRSGGRLVRCMGRAGRRAATQAGRSSSAAAPGSSSRRSLTHRAVPLFDAVRLFVAQFVFLYVSVHINAPICDIMDLFRSLRCSSSLCVNRCRTRRATSNSVSQCRSVPLGRRPRPPGLSVLRYPTPPLRPGYKSHDAPPSSRYIITGCFSNRERRWAAAAAAVTAAAAALLTIPGHLRPPQATPGHPGPPRRHHRRL